MSKPTLSDRYGDALNHIEAARKLEAQAIESGESGPADEARLQRKVAAEGLLAMERDLPPLQIRTRFVCLCLSSEQYLVMGEAWEACKAAEQAVHCARFDADKQRAAELVRAAEELAAQKKAGAGEKVPA